MLPNKFKKERNFILTKDHHKILGIVREGGFDELENSRDGFEGGQQVKKSTVVPSALHLTLVSMILLFVGCATHNRSYRLDDGEIVRCQIKEWNAGI